MIHRSTPALLLLSFLLLQTGAMAQKTAEPTPADIRTEAWKQRTQMRESSLFSSYPVRNVGPVVMGGRVTDLAVDPNDDKHFLVAFASGGVFETRNGGTTMDPIFDNVGTLTVGDVAWTGNDQQIIWVGTGEKNSSRSSYAGNGIYKSSDGGQSWEWKGLAGTQHIARIIPHPDEPQTAWVASMGALYHHNDERGVYKTTDGGESWDKTLFVNDSTGIIDLVIHPENPDILWASAWERTRKAWNFKGTGPGSAIYKSTDGGETWTKSVEGFPQGNFVGRIGLDVSHSNPDILYAVLDNQKETKTEKETDPDILEPSDFLEMSKKEFLNLEEDRLAKFLKSNGFPKRFTVQRIQKDIREGLYEPKALADFLGDANQALFDTDVTGAEVYRSDDGGSSWSKVNSYDFNVLYFTYGYYFGEIRVSPTDPDEVYIFGVPFIRSSDGGKTWTELAQNQDVHVDHHALWIDPDDTNHIILGNDGGVYQSWDKGVNFIHHNVIPTGQFYSVAVDMEKPYNIYGGLQDNGVFYGSSQGTPDDGTYWERVFGGDGMHVAIHPENSDLVYTGFQFGNYYRIDKAKRSYQSIKPSHDIGEPRYRFNWNTPVNMSHHNPDIIYYGSQKLNISFNRGDDWQTISGDLSTDAPQGNVPYSTLTTVAESPISFGTIWGGTDDGKIHLTTSMGDTWKEVSGSLPQNRWVSEIHASAHDEATAYVSLTGYRFDEFKTYLYKTVDYGKSWQSIKGNLPEENVNVIVQDPVHPKLLYTGTDQGTYVSFDDGEMWHLVAGIPNVASYDMVVHPRDHELVVGTHGRSIYVTDVKPLHELMTRDERKLVAFALDGIRYSERWGNQSAPFREVYEPGMELLFFTDDRKAEGRTAKLEVADSDGKVEYATEIELKRGFNRFTWNLKHNPDAEKEIDRYLGKGEYTITLTYRRAEDAVTLVVE